MQFDDVWPVLTGVLLTPWGLAVLGLCVGSFLNVVIHRLPRMLEREWQAQAHEVLAGDAPAGQADAANDRPGRRKALLERIFTRQLPGARIEGRTPQVGRELGVLLTVQFTLIPGQAMKRCVLIRQRGAHPAVRYGVTFLS